MFSVTEAAKFNVEAFKLLFVLTVSAPSVPLVSPITKEPFPSPTFTVTLSKSASSPIPTAVSISISSCFSPSAFTKVPSIKIEVLLLLFSFIAAIAEVK